MGLKVNFIFLGVILGLCVAIANGTSAGGSKEGKIVQCGGTIDADSDSLSYPGPGESLQPGEVCIWTIHLETTRDFKFNFTNDFDVSSSQPECRSSGVRIYSLTNLVPSENLQSYTFCNSQPPYDNFYLGENIAVVVLYTSTATFNPGTGFTLTWEGTAYDPMRTKHLSSFSSASSDVIRYPVVGSYEPNLAATWLIKTVTPQETTRSDFSLDGLDLESCVNTGDRCTCDALILYEISSVGVLTESRRFCEDSTGIFLNSVESRFIVAFFTDFETVSGGGSGFEILYYPTTTTTTYDPTGTTLYPTGTTRYPTTYDPTGTTPYPTGTTPYPTTYDPTGTTPYPTTYDPTGTTPYPTTYPPTAQTTTNDPPLYSTRCGEILSGSSSGTISYKAGHNYAINERCVWTIRIPTSFSSSTIKFKLVSSGISQGDGIRLSTFARVRPPKVADIELTGSQSVTLFGNIAVVTFFSDAITLGQGFILNYEATTGDPYYPIISTRSRDFISNVPSVITHPMEGPYYTNELSTFVITYPNFQRVDGYQIEVEITIIQLETCCSCDRVNIYKFTPTAGWNPSGSLCYNSSIVDIVHNDISLYVFTTDYNGQEEGLRLSAVMNSYPSTTPPWEVGLGHGKPQ